MREVVTTAPSSALRRVSPVELAHEQAMAELAAEERQRRREAVLHSLAVARSRRRRRPVSRFA